MSVLSHLATAGNMQTYQQQLQSQQQASAIANALNALKLQAGQSDFQGAGIAGNAALSAMGGDQGAAAPQQPPIMPPPVQQVPMPGASPLPPQKPILPPPPGSSPAMNMPQGTPPAIPPVTASSLQPPPAQPAMPQQPPAAPGQPQGALTWQKVAMAIKQKNPEASGQAIMAAIDHLTPMLSAQSKTDWEQFKLQTQTQVKEQGMQNQMDIANRRADTAERGQDVRSASELASVRQRADAAEARVQELEANRGERAREADQRNQTSLKSIETRLSSAKKGNDPAYKALQDEYKTTAAAQRSMMNNPGMYDEAAKAAMEQKVQALQSRVDAYTKTAAPSTGGAGLGGERVTVTKGGQDFTVPAEQLQDAISQGYTRK